MISSEEHISNQSLSHGSSTRWKIGMSSPSIAAPNWKQIIQAKWRRSLEGKATSQRAIRAARQRSNPNPMDQMDQMHQLGSAERERSSSRSIGVYGYSTEYSVGKPRPVHSSQPKIRRTSTKDSCMEASAGSIGSCLNWGTAKSNPEVDFTRKSTRESSNSNAPKMDRGNGARKSSSNGWSALLNTDSSDRTNSNDSTLRDE